MNSHISDDSESDIEIQAPPADDAPIHAKTRADLTNALGITRPTLNSMLDTAGFPVKRKAGWKIAEVKSWIASNWRGTGSGAKNRGRVVNKIGIQPDDGEIIPPPKGYASHQDFKVAMEGQRQKVALDRSLGKLADKPFVKQVVARGQADLWATLMRVFCSEMPAELAGQDALTIETKLRASLIQSQKDFKAALEAWENEE